MENWLSSNWKRESKGKRGSEAKTGSKETEGGRLFLSIPLILQQRGWISVFRWTGLSSSSCLLSSSSVLVLAQMSQINARRLSCPIKAQPPPAYPRVKVSYITWLSSHLTPKQLLIISAKRSFVDFHSWVLLPLNGDRNLAKYVGNWPEMMRRVLLSSPSFMF